ncbi:MAG: AAA family ATPase [Actinomycetota bacterium]
MSDYDFSDHDETDEESIPDDHPDHDDLADLIRVKDNDRHLTDEEILILINVSFEDGESEDDVELGEEWYPNIRAMQLLHSVDPARTTARFALRDLVRDIRRRCGDDWNEARRLLRTYGLEIAVEYAPLNDVEAVSDSGVDSSPLHEEMQRRQRSLLSRERDLAPTADERRSMASNRRASVFEPRPIDEILGELAQMEGMTTVADWSRSLVAQCHTEHLRRRAGLPRNLEMPRHLVLRGEPGTGKTVGARLLTELYAALGIVRYPKFIEASRADLVAGYLGQTALKTRGIFTQALGGVLFIDEAYSLNAGGHDFGDEAVAELIQLMETHRNDVAVFFAGYPAEMQNFIRMNTGLASRVSATLDFHPYTNEELWKVLRRMALTQSFMVDDAARGAVFAWFDRARAASDFGNARSARHLVNLMKANHAERIYVNGLTGIDDLILLTAADVPEGDHSEKVES